jgi:PAS domain S-box-containing protein
MMRASLELLVLFRGEVLQSVFMFLSEETFWTLNKWWIFGAFLLAVVEALLIGGLVISHFKRKRIQEALSKSEELHRVILSNISDTVFITDDQGAFTFVCPNVQVIFGYSYDEVWQLGHITRLLGRDDFLPEKLAAAEMRNIEQKVTSKSGQESTLLVSVKRVAIGEGTMLYVCRDISDLSESHARIEDLAGRLIHAQEEERKFIARELHDDISQIAAVVGLELTLLKRQISEASDGVLSRVDDLQARTSTLCDHIRQLSHNLHSTTLDQTGLIAALHNLCVDFTEREDIAVELRTPDDVEQITPDAALCLYRVTQEALRNVAKHSGAKTAAVSLTGSEESILLHVTDPGRGFDLKKAAGSMGLGLASMEERVRLLQGNFSVITEPGAGTELKAEIPVHAHQRFTQSLRMS